MLYFYNYLSHLCSITLSLHLQLFLFFMVLFNFFYANKKLQINSLFWRSNIIIEKEKIKLSAYRKNYSVCFIIPARNEEKYISKTIESILSQKVKKFIVIINDNSLDSTEKKCKKNIYEKI